MPFFQASVAAATLFFAASIAAAQQPGEQRLVKVDGVEFPFRWCPANPEASVKSGFWMLETEVTQAQYKAATGIDFPAFVREKSRGQYISGLATGVNRPVTWLERSEIDAFCKALTEKLNLEANGKAVRLPDQYEWEHAYRAGTKADYFWDDDFEEYPVRDYVKVGGSYPEIVAEERKPNAWGLYDMAGNAWELATHSKNATLSYKVGGSFQTDVDTTYISDLRGVDADIAKRLSATYRGKHDGKRSGLVGFRVLIAGK